MTYFDIVLSTSASLHPDMEPDDFISSYQAVIRAEGNDGVTCYYGMSMARQTPTLSELLKPSR